MGERRPASLLDMGPHVHVQSHSHVLKQKEVCSQVK